MTISFKFFFDAALTQPVETGTTIPAPQLADNSLAPVDRQLWFGSNTSGTKAQAASNPGVDEIIVSPADSGAGSGETVNAVRLATSQAGLDSAIDGASLVLATTILAGVSNAFPFWVRIDDTTGVAGTYTDLSLVTNPLNEL